MAQYVYTMNGVGKIVPPKREILKNISLSFFPGAKIGVLGLNGSGKSTLLRIMAGIDTDIIGEARPMADIKVGYLPQEPQLDETRDVRGNVEDGVREALDALQQLDEGKRLTHCNNWTRFTLPTPSRTLTSMRWPRSRDGWKRSSKPGMRTISTPRSRLRRMPCACPRGKQMFRIFPVVKNAA
jgi:energy-coupling factor transporter ATP-binding protein EcfA2